MREKEIEETGEGSRLREVRRKKCEGRFLQYI